MDTGNFLCREAGQEVSVLVDVLHQNCEHLRAVPLDLPEAAWM